MKFLPSYNVFDEMFDDVFYSPLQKRSSVMKTDVKETDEQYEFNVELPGYKKEDINISLENGYLIINAKTDDTKEEKNEDGKVIRRERYSGSSSRRFYVSNKVKEEDIKAKFENGELRIDVPKYNKPEIEEKKTIEIK